MKKFILLLGTVYFLGSGCCFSQESINTQREYQSKTGVVKGYSNDFNELNMGITFGKVINPSDTAYYVKFQLYAPSSEFRNDIQIRRSDVITFLSENGRAVDLQLADVSSSTEKAKQVVDPVSTVNADNSTILVLNITRETLAAIGSGPFYKLILPYYNSSSRVEEKAVFAWPTLLTRRVFLQKNVKYILDI